MEVGTVWKVYPNDELKIMKVPLDKIKEIGIHSQYDS
jgi:hypothetical protein